MDIDMNGFMAYHNGVTNSVVSDFKRYLFHEIFWSESSITVIGERGVGKTTMLIQYAKANFEVGSWIYLSGDFFLLQSVGLFNFVSSYFNTYEGEAIIIDEIHKYQGWKTELKNVLDAFPNKQILVSGSSAIHLLKSKTTTTDLERRRALYVLHGMSLREYLNFKYSTELPKLSLDDIVANHPKISLAISSKVDKLLNSAGILKDFYTYLEEGYYPFSFVEKGTFKSRVLRTIDAVIEQDIAQYLDLNRESALKIKKLFLLCANSKPFTPNIQSIAKDLGLSRTTVYSYLEYLEASGLTRNVFSSKHKAGHHMTKPDKICIANTNIIAALKEADHLTGNPETIGTLREIFFVSNFSSSAITTSKKADYVVDGFSFEVGGKGKNRRQIYDLSNSYLAVDGINISSKKDTIPLWLFGFLY